MTFRPNPDRARQLRQRGGYTVTEIAEHMNAEGRDVHPAEVTAWISYGTPPKLYEFEGKRQTIAEIAKAACVTKHLLAGRLARGMSLADAITRPISTPQQSGRLSRTPGPMQRACS